jgi:hypothetical protein
MTCRLEIARGVPWRLCPDDPAVVARSLVLAQVRDEISERAPQGGFRLRSSRRDMAPRIAIDGIAGLVGDPARALDPPTTVDVELTVEAPGYLPWRDTITIDPNNLPAERAVWLHRPGTRVGGRVVEPSGFDHAPLAGAIVTLDGVWPTFPPAGSALPADLPLVVSLVPGFYAGRSTSATLERRNMQPNPAQAKSLIEPAVPGTDRIRVSDRIGIPPAGLVIAIDEGHPDLTEYLPVAGFEGASTDDQPATLFLHHPIASFHREGATVAPVSVQGSFAQNALSRDAQAGDVCAFLVATTDLGAAAAIEISGGGPTEPEYHLVHHYTATAALDGSYRLPPIARVAQIRLDVSHPSILSPLQPIVAVDYHDAEHRFDVISS